MQFSRSTCCFFVLCALLLASCSHYRLAVKSGASRSTLPPSKLTLSVTPLRDIRELFPENSAHFNLRKKMTKGVIEYCMNDEGRYEKELPIRFQASELLANRIRERGFFSKVQYNTTEDADYYIAGDIKYLLGMQMVGFNEALINEATAESREKISTAYYYGGLIAALVTLAVEAKEMEAEVEKVKKAAPEEMEVGDAIVMIVFSNLKLYGKNREFVADLPEAFHLSYENRELDKFTCGNIYDYVNEGLEQALDMLAKSIEKKVTKLEKSK